MSARAGLALALAGLAAGCQGDGSDIGPGFGGTPPDPFQVTVFDDAGRPVTGAVVVADGQRAVTGRMGRAEFPALWSGNGLLTVQATAASARASDALAGLAVRAATVDAGRMLDRALFLPDVSASAGLPLATGLQPGAVTLDDTAASGAVLEIGAGSTVTAGPLPAVTIRTAPLQARHLPATPPPAGGVPALVSAAVLVAPEDLRVAPAAVLSIADPFAATGNEAIDVLRFDPASGAWTRIGAAAVAAGRLRADLVDRGGLYVFVARALAGTAGTTVTGRVLGRDGRPAPRAFVHGGGLVALTGDDGRFALGPLAGANLSGDVRVEVLELAGGRGYLPAATRAELALQQSGLQDVGDLRMDAEPSGHLRVLYVERGRVLRDQRVRTGDEGSRGSAEGFAGADGMVVLEDVPEGFYGLRGGRALDRERAFLAEGSVRLVAAQRLADLRVFSQDRAWDENRRNNLVEVVGAHSGALLGGAVLVRGADPGAGFLGETFESGTFFTALPPGDQLTAVHRSEGPGRRVVSAFTIVGTSGHRLQLPVVHVTRATAGFDRHGLVDGEIGGGVAGRTRVLRVTRPLRYGDWFDRVMLDDASSGGNVPVKAAAGAVGPTATFRAGVPLPRGHVALAEGELVGGALALERAFVAHDVVVPEGEVRALQGSFAPAGALFTARGLLAGLDPRIAAGELRFDWAVERGGTLADAARGAGGASLVPAGADVAFRLPEPAAGSSQHVCLVGRTLVAGVTLEQRAVVAFGGGNDVQARPMLRPPAILAPAPGGTVSAGGFTVAFEYPEEATYVMVVLASDDGTELRRWEVLAFDNQTRFDFRVLPAEAPAVLASGRTWQLTVSAHRVANGPLPQQANPFNSVIANFASVRPGALGVDAIGSATITISTQ